MLFLVLDRPAAGLRSEARQVALLGCVYALLAATHPPQTLLAVVVASAYTLLMRGVRALLLNAIAALSGLLLSASSALPAVAMQRYITPGGWQTGIWFDVGRNFLFSVERWKTYFISSQEIDLHLTWLLCAAVLVLALGSRRLRARIHGERAHRLVILQGLSLLAMTKLFSGVWTHTPMRSVQFPWRLFPLSLLLTAALVALLVDRSNGLQRSLLALTAVLVTATAVVPYVGLQLSSVPRQKHPTGLSLVEYFLPRCPLTGDRELPVYSSKRSAAPEYIPAQATAAGWRLSKDEDTLVPPPGVTASPALPVPTLRESRAADGSFSLDGSAETPTAVLLPTFYFPDLTVAGTTRATLVPDKASGLTRVVLPQGPVSLRITHTGTPPIIALADAGSLCGALWISLLLLLPGAKRSVETNVRVEKETVRGRDLPGINPSGCSP